MQYVLCVVGMPGSGKSTVVQIIRKKFNACIFSTGDIIREEIKRRGLKYTKENDKKISLWFHEGREELLIKRLCKKIKKCKNKTIVIEGLRAEPEPKIIQKCLNEKPVLIAVQSRFSIRFKRWLKRKRFPEGSRKKFREREEREKKYGLEKLMAKADFKLNNNESLRNLEKKTIKLMKSIL